MAFSKSKAIEKIQNVSTIIFDHLIKAFIYKNTTNDLHHWIHDEIVPQFEYISRIKIKTPSGKLKEVEYYKAITSSVGEDKDDFEAELYGFFARNRSYKKLNITKELVDNLYEKYNNVIDNCIKAIINNNQNFEKIIYKEV